MDTMSNLIDRILDRIRRDELAERLAPYHGAIPGSRKPQHEERD